MNFFFQKHLLFSDKDTIYKIGSAKNNPLRHMKILADIPKKLNFDEVFSKIKKQIINLEPYKIAKFKEKIRKISMEYLNIIVAEAKKIDSQKMPRYIENRLSNFYNCLNEIGQDISVIYSEDLRLYGPNQDRLYSEFKEKFQDTSKNYDNFEKSSEFSFFLIKKETVDAVSFNSKIVSHLEEMRELIDDAQKEFNNNKLKKLSNNVQSFKSSFENYINKIKKFNPKEIEIAEIKIEEIDLNPIKHLVSQSQSQLENTGRKDSKKKLNEYLDSQISNDSGFDDNMSSTDGDEIQDDTWFDSEDDNLELDDDKWFDKNDRDVINLDIKTQTVEYYKNTQGEMVENKSFKISDLTNLEFSKEVSKNLQPSDYYQREQIDDRSFLQQANDIGGQMASIVSNKYNNLTNSVSQTTKNIGWAAGKQILNLAARGLTAIQKVPNTSDATSNAIQNELNKTSATSNPQSNNANQIR